MAGRRLDIWNKNRILFPVTLRSLEDCVLGVTVKIKNGGNKTLRFSPYNKTLKNSHFKMTPVKNSRHSSSRKYDTDACAVVPRPKHKAIVRLQNSINLDDLVNDVHVPKNIERLTRELTAGLATDDERFNKIYEYIRENVTYSYVPTNLINKFGAYLERNKNKDKQQAMRGYFPYIKRILLSNVKGKVAREKLEKMYYGKMSDLLEEFCKKYLKKHSKPETIAKRFLNYCGDKWNTFFTYAWDSNKKNQLAYHKANKGYCSVMSKIMRQMLASAGIESVLVTGLMRQDKKDSWGAHMWLAVKLNDKWRHVETTSRNPNVHSSNYVIPLSVMPQGSEVIEAVAYTRKELKEMERYGLLSDELKPS